MTSLSRSASAETGSAATAPVPPGTVPVSVNHRIAHWNSEDVQAWEGGGKQIAKRNLIWSVVAEHVGFSIWSIWSIEPIRSTR